MVGMAPKKSETWAYFVARGETIAKCKICNKNISYKSGVSNLTKHVQRKHIVVKLVARESAVPVQLQNSDGQEVSSQLASPSQAQVSNFQVFF